MTFFEEVCAAWRRKEFVWWEKCSDKHVLKGMRQICHVPNGTKRMSLCFFPAASFSRDGLCRGWPQGTETVQVFVFLAVSSDLIVRPAENAESQLPTRYLVVETQRGFASLCIIQKIIFLVLKK